MVCRPPGKKATRKSKRMGRGKSNNQKKQVVEGRFAPLVQRKKKKGWVRGFVRKRKKKYASTRRWGTQGRQLFGWQKKTKKTGALRP